MSWVPKGCRAVARHGRRALASFVPRLHPTNGQDDLRSADTQSDRGEGHDTYDTRSHATPASPRTHGALAAVGCRTFPNARGARHVKTTGPTAPRGTFFRMTMPAPGLHAV